MEQPKNTPETAQNERAVQSEASATPTDATARTELSGEAPRRDPWLGRVLDERYRITERLGEGGMGAVFVAEHLKLRKQVALKVIRAELAGNGEVAARFAREAMATAQFEHPHVASAIDYGTLAEGGAYLVMQLVRGQSLRQLLDEHGRLPWPLACELLAQVADALSAARGAGIVHRDLKPENILVETREDGSRLAKILDFGIAHVAPQGSHASNAPLTRELTRIGTVMGTPGYMSPEQAVGDKVDHRTDIYALGVVLWECIAGRVLWDGPDITSIIARQMRENVPRLREAAPDVRIPRELDDLIQRLCARTLELRPDHAGAVRDELRVLAHARNLPQLPWLDMRDVWARARLRWLHLPVTTRVLYGLGALATVLTVLALARSPATPNLLQPAGGTAVPTASVGSEAAADSGKKPSLVEQAMRAARGVIAEGALRPEIPAELKDDVQTLRESTKSTERRRAAVRVLAYKNQSALPAYVRAIARLEEARSCRDRREAIGAMATLGDTRCLDALRRYADAGRTGCGFLTLEDCYGCIRNDLRKAIDSLEAKPQSASDEP